MAAAAAAAAAARGHYRSYKEIVYDASAGAAAGAIAATFVCPLDVIKTRLQVHGLPETHNSGLRGSVILTSLQNIVRKEGFKGLYRGLTPTLAALLPNWAVYFTVYGHLKELLHSYEGGNDQLSIASNMIAASGAGASTAIATNPLWVVKTRLQTQGMREGVVPYKNIISALGRIAREEGFRGWYSGLLPSLAGISHVAIQFPAYERIKFYFAKQDNKSSDELSPGELVVASSFSKVLASLLTYPHEVVRSRLQEQGQVRNADKQYAGVIDCIRKISSKDGIPGFYRGCATNLLRTTPSAVITFTSYEMIHRFLLHVSPPEGKHSKPNSKPDGQTKPQNGTESPGGNMTVHQTPSPSSDRTPFVPLGKTDNLTAKH